MNRRTVLIGAVATAGLGGYLYSQTETPSCEISCFEFHHEGFDDGPDWLTIMHTEGRDLPAEEVFITNVVVEAGERIEWVTDTMAWHEVDEGTEPTEGIGGKAVRIDVVSPSTVQILWRPDGDEQILAEP